MHAQRKWLIHCAPVTLLQYVLEMGNSGSCSVSTGPPVRTQLDVDEIQRLSHTADFNAVELKDYVITRRGCSIRVQLRQKKNVEIEGVDCAILEYVYDGTKIVTLELEESDIREYGASLQVGKAIT